MAYITSNDLYAEFGKTKVRAWTEADNKGNVNVDAAILAVIAEAESEFEDRLRGSVYSLPLSQVSGTVKRIVKGLALARFFSGGVEASEEERVYIRERIDESESLLLRVLMGSIRLDAATAWPVPTGPTLDTRGSIDTTIERVGRVLNREENGGSYQFGG